MNAVALTKPLTIHYLKTIGIVHNGFQGRGFTNPCDTAISNDGRIFVLNRCDPQRAKGIRVGICTFEGEDYLGEFGDGYGNGDTQFKLPAAMAFDKDERLHIVDEYMHRVTVYDSSGMFLGKWGIFGNGDGQLNGPSGIGFDSKNNTYIVNQHSNTIQKFTRDGEFLLGWGEPGNGDGQFNMPWGLAIDGQDSIYVADWRNDRIQMFTSDGQFLAKFGESGNGEGQFHRPSAVAVDDQGYIYVADWGNERVQVLGPDGSFHVMLRGQATLSRWAKEFFASNPDETVERDKSTLIPDLPAHLSSAYHISSQTEPYFWGPISVTLDNEARLYVTETNRHRFQIYQRD